MPGFACRFCAHENPLGSEFCNACGSPLNLKPCPQCEAVNKADAAACYQCGASFADEAEALAMAGADEDAAARTSIEDTDPDVPVEHAAPVEPAAPIESPGSVDSVGFTEPAVPARTPEFERARTPELFAHSLDTLAELERIVLHSPARSEAITALRAPAESRAREERRREHRAQGIAVALALIVAIEALAYLAHRPVPALDTWLGSIQRGVLGFAHATRSALVAESPTTTSKSVAPAVSTQAEPVVPPAADAPTSSPVNAIEPSDAAAVDTPAESTAPLVEESKPMAPPVETSAQPTTTVPSSTARSETTSKPARSSAVAAKRQPPVTRPRESPVRPLEPEPAPTSAERPCTPAVAALGLCDPARSP